MIKRFRFLLPVQVALLVFSASFVQAEEADLQPVEVEPDSHTHLKLSVPPLEADRPDFTETTQTVPPGSLQFEGGALWEKDEGTRTWHFGNNPLLRLGITEKAEARLVLPEYVRQRGEEPANNFADMQVGFKHRLPSLPGDVNLSLLPMIILPTGANKVSENGVGTNISLLWSRDFGEKTEVGGNLTFALHNEEGRTVAGFSPTLVVYRELNEKWGALVEYFGAFEETGRKINLLHYAVTYKPTPRQQFDARFGHALSGDAPSLLVGVGYSFRIDDLF